MAKQAPKSVSTKPGLPPSVPFGFKKMERKNVDGFFTLESGNSVRGTLDGSFIVKSTKRGWPDKKVHRVVIVENHPCKVIDSEGEEKTITEGTVGLDEKGYLKKLSDLTDGQEIFVECEGKKGPNKEDPWVFSVYLPE